MRLIEPPFRMTCSRSNCGFTEHTEVTVVAMASLSVEPQHSGVLSPCRERWPSVLNAIRRLLAGVPSRC